MKKYLGVKVVEAEPMTHGNFVTKKYGANAQETELSKANVNTEGYLVQYEDGYISWSPKEVFEKAYTQVKDDTNFTQDKCKKLAETWTESDNRTEFTFGVALESMKQGHKVARKGWNGKGIFLELQVPDEHSKMTHPYIYIDTTGLQTDNKHAPKDRVPWLASQTDMLAEDWFIVE